MPSFNYKSYASLVSTIQKNSHRFVEFNLIVGVPRSGIFPASILATHLNIPFATLSDIVNGNDLATGFRLLRSQPAPSRMKVLIVDDSVNSGRQMRSVRNMIENTTLEYKTMAVYSTSEGAKHIDYYLEEVSYPRVFEWNILNHEIATRACYDLDGVLCANPSPHDTSNESSYVNFIRNALPLHIPSHSIRAIVTSRLEKYRKETEEWLTRNGIFYEELYMLDGLSADQRMSLMMHAVFKSSIFKDIPAELFIESDKAQAIAIARICGKPCFSVQDMNMYYSDLASEGCYVDSMISNLDYRVQDNNLSHSPFRNGSELFHRAKIYARRILKFNKIALKALSGSVSQ